MSERFRVEVAAAHVTAHAYATAMADPPLLVLGPGAGAPQTSPFMIDMAEGLAARGVEVVTFDFMYAENKKKLPDRPALLEQTYRAVLAVARDRAKGRPLFAGGKSMGGRIASQIAENEAGLAGLVFLGYPLHPPGKPEVLRTKHLAHVNAPMLFVQGTRDPFGGPDELRPLLPQLPRGTEICPVEGGDHSFKVPKKAGIAQADVMTAVKDEVVRWVMGRVAGRA